ncbi:glycosyltransferase family 2 protein [Silvimonas sp.]|uniref:glycosyltransferase family 2 protein n=1 Tax=Silvimonas sp. TaxID=2650811 RepID=UPI00283C687C|nr:glycosyltransferase family 2 protein [Silvimonas sp.]MDR3429426.1 glycosyltransferase family 2 protein [Silvimonas sp.]
MKTIPILTISVVVYKTPTEQLLPLFASILQLENIAVCVVDNYGDPALEAEVSGRDWTYVRPPSNLGYGRAHNLAFSYLRPLQAEFHLVVNPDISFEAQGMQAMISHMRDHPEVGQLMPRIVFPDGRQQFLCKLLPTPADLILRRFLPSGQLKRALRDRYELRKWSYAEVADIPSLSGCFMLLRSMAFEECGGFDERYFMYLEDLDICRRIGMRWRTRYFPLVQVTHAYARGSYNNARMLTYHVASAIRYFSRWGWVFDSYRKMRNKKAKIELGL